MRRIAKTLTSQIAIAIGLLTVLALAFLAGLAFFAARNADEEALRKEKMLVQRGIFTLIASVPREQESFSTWDEGVIQINARDERWIVEEFGGWMHRFFKHDRTYILDPDNHLIFAAQGEKVARTPAFGGDGKAIGAAVTQLRKSLAVRNDDKEIPRGEIYVANIEEVEGRPAIVSARPILPHTDRVDVPDGKENLFVAVKFIDGSVVGEIANRTLVQALRYEPARNFVPTQDSVKISSREGKTIGYFVWTPSRPGLNLMRKIAPWAGLALAFAGGVGFYQARNLHRASVELQASEGRTRYLAFHDRLTALPNRALLDDRLDETLGNVMRGHNEAAVLLLDLDRFKNINDTLGHRAGDQVVQQAAARLEDVVGQSGTIARIGGDEFAVVISAEDAADAAKRLSDQLLAALAPPFQVEDDFVHVGASIGIVTAPQAATRREELLRKADIALYEAKKQGRGHYQFFAESMDDVVKQRRAVEADLRKALTKGNELEVVYQPLYSADGHPTGAEALLRWNHPVHHSISPMFLITIAEECGLIVQIGDWVLHEACRMAKRVPVPWIAVNVSPVQLRDPNFARRCLDIIKRYQIPPQRIQIEITEAVVIENPEITCATLSALRAAGVHVALDDFGTGYSSMSYLQNYPLDRLKIDRLFVRALSEGEEGKAIVAAMIDMARALKLGVTAEGVETPEQRKLLVQMGCHEMQGFLFSKPISAAEFVASFFPAHRTKRA